MGFASCLLQRFYGTGECGNEPNPAAGGFLVICERQLHQLKSHHNYLLWWLLSGSASLLWGNPSLLLARQPNDRGAPGLRTFCHAIRFRGK